MEKIRIMVKNDSKRQMVKMVENIKSMVKPAIKHDQGSMKTMIRNKKWSNTNHGQNDKWSKMLKCIKFGQTSGQTWKRGRKREKWLYSQNLVKPAVKYDE